MNAKKKKTGLGVLKNALSVFHNRGASRQKKAKQAISKQQMNKMINGLICMGLVLSGDACPSVKNVADLQSRGMDAPHEIIFISSAWLLLITWSPRRTLALCAM